MLSLPNRLLVVLLALVVVASACGASPSGLEATEPTPTEMPAEPTAEPSVTPSAASAPDELRTATVGDLSDVVLSGTVQDLFDQPGAWSLARTDFGAQTCPLGASQQDSESLIDFDGDLVPIGQEDFQAGVDLVTAHIEETFAEDAPIATAELAIHQYEPDDIELIITALWDPDDVARYGAWFSLLKIEDQFQIVWEWGCTPFLFG